MIFDEFLVDDLDEELEYEFWYDDKGRVVAKIPIDNKKKKPIDKNITTKVCMNVLPYLRN